MEQTNELALQQEELGQAMTKLLTNLKKDATSRKTESYIETKMSTLEEYWNKAKINDEKITELKVRTHNYFTTNYFSQMKQIYENAKAYIEECRRKTRKEEGEDSKSTASLMNQIIEDFKELAEKISEEILQDKTRIRYKILQDKLDREWEAFNEERQKNSVQRGQQKEISELYDHVRENLFTKMEKLDGKGAHSWDMPLPQITLPKFNGSYEQWTTFADLFDKMIHTNMNLSDVQKMQHLKSHLRGEASKLIQHLPISETNYETAWRLLRNRYHNERLLITKLLDRMLDLPKVQNGSARELKELHDTTNECLQAIANMGIDTQSWGPMVIRIVTRKWDEETRRLYEQSLKNPHEIENLEEMMKFLQQRFQALETTVEEKKKKYSETEGSSSRKENQKFGKECKYCREQHWITQCQKFRELDSFSRMKAIQERKICVNCLRHDKSQECRSSSRCSICQQFHHTLLHKEKRTQSRQETNVKNDQQKTKQVSSNMSTNRNKDVLLATALIKARTSNGTYEILRALVDPGSQASFITEQAAQLLLLPKEKVTAEITGLGGEQPRVANAKVEVELSPHFPSVFTLNTSLLLLSKLTSNLPRNQLENDMGQWKNHILADPTYFKPGPIDVIIGAAEYSKIIQDGLFKTENGLLAQNSELGWFVSGAAEEKVDKEIKITSMVARYDEDSQLTKFWEQEEIPQKRELTQEEQACEEFYQNTTVRNTDGRYTVKIPFKKSPGELGQSKLRATARYLQLEMKLKKNKNLNEQYKTFMKEYLELNHMKIVPKSQENQRAYYIPHHAVIKEDSSTTKLRVVYDASCKTSSGTSLNEIMHTGPRLQQELSDIVLRWRIHKIGFSADIEKMYRQIWIDNNDQKYQRILWRFEESQPIREYSLNTVTYGTTSAPYLAIKTLQRLADDETTRYPQAAEVCKRDFYVDDILSGCDTIQEATHPQDELIALLKSGGFSLRKWSSNDVRLVKRLPEDLRDQDTLEIFEDGTKKSLGLHWAPHVDKFWFKPQLVKQSKLSKRCILSEISRLYDPLGWLAPIVIKAKLLIQELWIQQLGWDELVPVAVQDQWLSFQGQMSCIDEITLPRWINYEKRHQIELHGFCDASERAYGAAVYSKVTTQSGEVYVHLLTAKSKVAPLKTRTTLPRLELCAAELLARLITRTRTALAMENIPIYNWTDSMITVGWINGEPQRWKTFVANRVSRIRSLTDHEQWRHVRTEENPADLISRGTEPLKLKQNSLWWHGPKWLQEQKQWPKNKEIQTLEEMRVVCSNTTVVSREPSITERFSELFRMARVLSYCRRFIARCKKIRQDNGPITVQELNETMECVIKMVQKEEYNKEIEALKRNKIVEKHSKLANLSPFIDEHGIMRVGGRLQQSHLVYDEKHPVILPSHHHLTNLIIQDAHKNTLHGGVQLSLSYTRKKYWIVNGKKMVSSKIRKCIKCLRYKAETSQQLMGSLPAPRVTPSPPFTHTGVDYAGPIQVRTTKGRGHKAYKGFIAIFVCFATKAIHMEVVSDMTTAAFLAAYRRFVARRGHCAHIYSDNGTTFVGASNIIANIPEKLATLGTRWHFIPPSTPHFGGLWEAGVKSMKHHLKRVIGDSTLTYEELTTLIYQIEACLNSRPLCTLSNNIKDAAVLTPGHFLIGRALLSPAELGNTNENISTLSRWRILQKMKSDFWKSWSSEYLGRLQQRYKWKVPCDNVNIGEMVLIKESNINPSKWPLARIKDIHPASDGTIRVVTLQRPGGVTLKRSIHKLIPLPKEEVKNEEKEKSSVKLEAHTTLVRKHKSKPRLTWKVLVWALICILRLADAANPLYSIQYPKPGMYIEHIGHTRINRGTFRIEMRFEKARLEEDAQATRRTTAQMEELCKSAAQISRNTHCDAMVTHLQEKEKQMEWVQKGLNNVIRDRQRRGLLGDVLTSVFGVNDEVYKNIEDLDKNQHELIRASNHQTKFMIQALSRFNDTEIRINKKIHQFQEKLNQGFNAFSEMNKWFRSVDENRVSIHLLCAYQLAESYIEELLAYYRRLLEIHFNSGLFYEFLSSAQVEETINTSSKNLPSNIQIITYPIIKTDVQHRKNYISVYGYFAIAQPNDFLMVKVTPVPLRVEHETYWILDVKGEMLAIDYNTQQYFQITEEEVDQCLGLNNHKYVCSPTIVYDIEESPHCVIDVIYERTATSSCPVLERKLSTTIWKQLYSPNTWFFITPEPLKVAVICNGNREDVTLNRTGTISVDQSCIINTRKNVLSPRKSSNVPIMASFSKPVVVNLTSLKSSRQHRPHPQESMMKPSDNFQDLQQMEIQIHDDLQEVTWRRIKHHQMGHSILTGGIIVIIIIILWVTRKYLCWRRRHQPTSQHQRQGPEMIELAPLQIPSQQESTLG